MEKLKRVLTNLYNSDSEIMIYVYIAIAVISIFIVILIIISTFMSKKSNKKVAAIKKNVPATNKQSLKREEDPILKDPIINTKEASLLEENQLIEETPNIEPILNENNIYDKPLELESELDLTRPIHRVDTALDILDEFTEELPLIEETRKIEKFIPEEKKPKINLEFTQVTPTEIKKIVDPNLPETKELVLNPEVLKPDIELPKEHMLIESSEDDSLDTKVNIFSHESLAETPKFDPFKPKTQEELIPEKPKETNTMVLSAEDIKHRLAMLKSNLPKKESEKPKEPAKELNEVLSYIGLDEIPDLYENKTEEVNHLRK
ncbi:MAG: hypothetical protein PHG03_05750 [Bacilli bacterium]|nr:hypothetical protein [Bacilli bacterium]MDD4796036.1 hypothetical protein [Bacilli bacterium]